MNLPPFPPSQTPSASLQTFRPLTAADVRDLIPTWLDLPQAKRRALTSALNGALKIAGLNKGQAAALTMDCAILNQKLFARSPSAFGFTPQRFGRIVSHIREILRRLGLHAPDSRGMDVLSEAWKALHGQLGDYRGLAMIGFMRFCSLAGIPPEAVTPETLTRFETWCRTQTLGHDPAGRARQTASGWNWAAKHIPGWPAATLARPRMRDHYTLPFEAYPESFQQDVELFRRELAGTGTLFATDFQAARAKRGRRRMVKPRTVEARTWQLRQAAAALVLQGHAPETVKTLRDLVEPIENASKVMKFFEQRAKQIQRAARESEGQEPIESGDFKNGQLANIADLLRIIAKFHCQLPDDHVATIASWGTMVRPEWRAGMTEKNRRRLQALIQPRPRAMLLHLPAELLRRASAPTLTPHAAARLAAYAVAVEILLVFPMRRSNLANLRTDLHLQRLGRQGRISHIFLSGSEVKNEVGVEWPLPPESGDLIDIYLKKYRPALAAPGNLYLFVGPGEKARSDHELAIGLCDLIEREIGVTVNIHLLRHFAAWNFLQAHPGQYEIVRQVLGHKKIETTIACYTGLEVDAAARHFDDVVLKARARTRTDAAAAFFPRGRISSKGGW